jgi:hypothetical protein
MPVTMASTLKSEGWHEGSGSMGAHSSATYMLMRRQIARFYSLVARVDWEYRRETITGDGLRLTQPRMKEAETMAYRASCS